METVLSHIATPWKMSLFGEDFIYLVRTWCKRWQQKPLLFSAFQTFLGTDRSSSLWYCLQFISFLLKPDFLWNRNRHFKIIHREKSATKWLCQLKHSDKIWLDTASHCWDYSTFLSTIMVTLKNYSFTKPLHISRSWLKDKSTEASQAELQYCFVYRPSSFFTPWNEYHFTGDTERSHGLHSRKLIKINNSGWLIPTELKKNDCHSKCEYCTEEGTNLSGKSDMHNFKFKIVFQKKLPMSTHVWKDFSSTSLSYIKAMKA